MHFTFRISKSSLIIYLLLPDNEHYFSAVYLSLSFFFFYVGCILLHPAFQKHMKNLKAQNWHLMQGWGIVADYCLRVCFVQNGQTDCRRLGGIKQRWFWGDLNQIKLFLFFSSKTQQGITKIRVGFTKNEVLRWLKNGWLQNPKLHLIVKQHQAKIGQL